MKNTWEKLRWFAVLGLVSILAACGGGPGGPRQLTDSDYIMQLTATFPEGAHSSGTGVWTFVVNTIQAQQRQTGGLSRGGVSTSGQWASNFDARQLASEFPLLDPATAVSSILSNWTATVSVSTPGAGFRMVHSTHAYQPDGSGRASTIASHNLGFPVTYLYGTITVQTTGTAVFSDKDVTVTSTTYTIGSNTFAANAEFQAGWNIAYWRRTSASSFELAVEHVTGPVNMMVDTRNYSFGTGSDPNVYGYSVLAEHQAGGPNPTVVHSVQVTNPITSASTRAWVGYDVMDNDLVPFGQAYPGMFTEAGVTTDPPEATALVAAVFAYDEAAMAAGGWNSDPEAALGQLSFESAAGNRIFYLYSDRYATMTVNETHEGTTYATPAGGLAVFAGWNQLELVPAGVNAYTVSSGAAATVTWVVANE